MCRLHLERARKDDLVIYDRGYNAFLMDTMLYNANQFKALYHLRWCVEENYKRLKQWVEIENFSGKSALSVRQDFHAKIVSANLTALMALAAQKQVQSRTKMHHYVYRVNFAQALSKMKHTLIALIQQAAVGVKALIEQTTHYIAMTFEAVRGGRHYARKFSHKLKNNGHCNQWVTA